MQDLHESSTVNSLERMASCTVRALPCQGQPHVFARAQQPDLAVEVCIKQRTGTIPKKRLVALDSASLRRVMLRGCHSECP